MFTRNALFSLLLPGMAFGGSWAAVAGPSAPTYTPVSDVIASQSQVVYYRAGSSNASPGAAHVYIDREFHTSLMPGNFTTFCVAPGQHSVGAYLNDSPAYRGKNSDVYAASFEGGKTYFLRIADGDRGAPKAVTRTQAEQELAASQLAARVLSRASAVQACSSVASTPPFKAYSLSADVLFSFGKSGYRDITTAGRDAIQQLIRELNREHENLTNIEVVGHTDPIGSASANYTLGLKRAQTVRRLLIEGGLPPSAVSASSAGANEPVAGYCDGGREEQIACYSKDRRVDVRVHTR
ncbi:TPA: OmpA family protein [Enterobacter kobei]|nr:OmpA family protein [Enterobacter kobei]